MKRLHYLAGLALAAAQITSPASRAQAVIASSGSSSDDAVLFASNVKPKHDKRDEFESRSDDAPFALAQADAAVEDAKYNFKRIFDFTGPTEQPLIISTSGPDEKSLSNLQEDITIMARILEKSLDRDNGDDSPDHKAMGIHLWALGQGGNRGARNMYLDGYGAVFTLNVNTPLMASKTKPEPEEKKEPGNSSWERARTEIYGGGDDDSDDHDHRAKERKAPAFDQHRFDELKNSLIDSLKNASHIRGLKDNESVTVVVQGPGVDRFNRKPRAIRSSGSGDMQGFVFAGQNVGNGPRSYLTLRAKKSDIDSFANEKMDEEDFRKKVSVSTYQTRPESNPSK